GRGGGRCGPGGLAGVRSARPRVRPASSPARLYYRSSSCRGRCGRPAGRSCRVERIAPVTPYQSTTCWASWWMCWSSSPTHRKFDQALSYPARTPDWEPAGVVVTRDLAERAWPGLADYSLGSLGKEPGGRGLGPGAVVEARVVTFLVGPLLRGRDEGGRVPGRHPAAHLRRSPRAPVGRGEPAVRADCPVWALRLAGWPAWPVGWPAGPAGWRRWRPAGDRRSARRVGNS